MWVTTNDGISVFGGQLRLANGCASRRVRGERIEILRLRVLDHVVPLKFPSPLRRKVSTLVSMPATAN